MKKIFIITFLNFLLVNTFAQDVLDQELKRLADQLAPKLLKQGNKKVAVINFTNLENQPTALGKALAEMFTIELTNTDLVLINRAQLNKLIEENKMMADGFIDEKEVVKLGQLKKVDIIVTGTATPMGKTILLTLQAIDIMQGTVIGGVKGNITSNEAIQSLMKDRVGDGIDEDRPRPISDSKSRDESYSPGGESKIDQPLYKCVKGSKVSGEVYIENRTNVPFEVYQAKAYQHYNHSILIDAGSRVSYGNLYVKNVSRDDISSKKFPSRDYIFFVRTTEEQEEKRRYGQILITVDGCKITTKSIGKGSILFKKK